METHDPAAEKGSAHSHVQNANSRQIAIALALTGAFLVAEVVGGIVFKSLALLSNAAHMYTDVAALTIALDALESLPMPSTRCCFSVWRSMSWLRACAASLSLSPCNPWACSSWPVSA